MSMDSTHLLTDSIYLFLLEELSDIPIKITSGCAVNDWIQILTTSYIPFLSYKHNGVEISLTEYITPNLICLLEERYNKI
jgi:hypothetical protein